MNKLGQWLWWMDRDDPRFRSSQWAKLGFAVVWALGMMALILVGEFMARMFVGVK